MHVSCHTCMLAVTEIYKNVLCFTNRNIKSWCTADTDSKVKRFEHWPRRANARNVRLYYPCQCSKRLTLLSVPMLETFDFTIRPNARNVRLYYPSQCSKRLTLLSVSAVHEPFYIFTRATCGSRV